MGLYFQQTTTHIEIQCAVGCGGFENSKREMILSEQKSCLVVALNLFCMEGHSG